MRRILLSIPLLALFAVSASSGGMKLDVLPDKFANKSNLLFFSGLKAVDENSKSLNENNELAVEPAETFSPMTLEKMAKIVAALDANAAIRDRAMQLSIADVTITIIADPKANRMRAFSAFQTLDGVDGQQLYRMMQANFDAALDARYAIAKGHVISVFIHPLAELRKDQLIEGIGQVVNLVKTFGTAYTSGAMTFGGGDSGSLHRALIDELLKKGKEI